MPRRQGIDRGGADARYDDLRRHHLGCTTAPDGQPLRLSGTGADVTRRRPDGTWGLLIDDPWGGPAG